MTAAPASSGARQSPRSEAELDAGVVDALRAAPGDIIILGAGGKMGPTLARMARRAADELADGRRVVAVPITGAPGVGTGATAAVVSVVSVDPCTDGYLTAFPCGAAMPAC